MKESITMPNMTVSEVLKTLMFKEDIRVSGLARKIGVPQQTLQRVVAGLSPNPHEATLVPLAEYFNITIDQLKGKADIPGIRTLGGEEDKPWHELPLLSWDEACEYDTLAKETLAAKKHILTEVKVSDAAYALTMQDSSMEPVYPAGTVMIVDPKLELDDRRYVIVKLKGENRAIIRWVTTDGRDYFLKLLNPDLSGAGLVKLTSEDKVLGVVVQAKRDLI